MASAGCRCTRPAGAHIIRVARLSQTDAKSGESRRNENVQFNLIDNNALNQGDQPAPRPRGNLGRYVFRRAPIRNWNAGLTGQWPLRKEWLMPSESSPSTSPTPRNSPNPASRSPIPNFGVITNTLNDGRTFRLSLRFTR